MYDTDYKTSNSSIIKPFQRIFFKNNSPNSQATPSTFLFKHNYTLANRISFVQKKKESFGLKCIQRMSLYGCLYSHKNYIQHKSFSKIKYCSLSDFIIAVMGKSNRCEIEGVIETLGSIRCLIAAIIRTSVVFSHTTTIHSQIVFHLYKKRDLRIETHPNNVSLRVSLFA